MHRHCTVAVLAFRGPPVVLALNRTRKAPLVEKQESLLAARDGFLDCLNCWVAEFCCRRQSARIHQFAVAPRLSRALSGGGDTARQGRWQAFLGLAWQYLR